MDNFTPLKTKKKSSKNFLLIGNLFLVIIVVFLGAFYVVRTKFPYKPKAEECQENNKLYCKRDGNACPNSPTSWYGYVCSSGQGTCYIMDGCAPFVNPGGGCSDTGFIGCSSENHRWNCYCTNNIITCSDNTGGTSCGYNSPGGNPPPPSPPPPTSPPNTPIPTETPVPPTNTPTPTIIVTNTPTPTPIVHRCNGTCNYSIYPPIACNNGLICYNSNPTPVRGASGLCRNINCPENPNCICVTPTATLTPTTPPGQPTNTPPAPTVTPIPVPCGTKDCDNATNPCRSNYICIQASTGTNFCSSPDYATACRANPTFDNCCTAPGAPTSTPTNTPTPTTVYLAKSGTSPTSKVTTTSMPSVGTPPWTLIIGILGTIIVGFIL